MRLRVSNNNFEIGQMKDLLTVRNYDDAQDAYGGNISEVKEEFNIWARVTGRSGGYEFSSEREHYNYDYELVFRFDNRILSNSKIEFANNEVAYLLKIEKLEIVNHNKKTYQIARCSVITL